MITVEEMREYLLDQFGIENDEDLDKELKKMGGIRIAIFTERYRASDNEKKEQLAAMA